MLYFAYGSNMSLARLRARTPSAERLGRYTLSGHQLRFHQHGGDGSAKCDAFYTGDEAHAVIGALYRLSPDEKPALDVAEGLGIDYQIKTVIVTDGARCQQAYTYCALRLNPGLLPFNWYVNHVLVGAREIQVPDGYLRALQGIDVLDDHDLERSRREWRLHQPPVED